MAVIRFVEKRSPFRKKALPGDDLIAVNGKPIHDFLDYMYLTASGVTEITVRRGEDTLVIPCKETYEDLGLEFENYLMDQQRSCKNKCIFCFIDQLPPNMRETMYYKDDDFRLSLLYGNYVTLTNLTDEDVERILEMKISPFNVSVHTTDPELRVKMMKNPRAGQCFSLLQRFAEAKINLRAQIVLCPGWNDGDALLRSLKDLKTLHPQLSSISVVPVGLTKFRCGLEPLRTYTPEECRRVVAQVESFAKECLETLGTRLVWAADELYVKGGLPIPAFDDYEEFEQLENGVGMLASFRRELTDALDLMEEPITRPIRVSTVTGKITEQFFKEIVEEIRCKYTDLQCDVYGIRNDFFGEEVTVTGLVTGQDILAQLSGKSLGDYLLVPSVMLRDDRFLDDVTVRQVSEALHVKVKVVPPDGEGFAEALLRAARR